MRFYFVLFVQLLFFITHAQTIGNERVVIQNDGWELIGDLLIPISEQKLSSVILLNRANGDRTVYKDLADQLAKKGIASLRLDLRGHGESTNLGKFVPGEVPPPNPMIYDSEKDVIAAINFLKNHPQLDSSRMGGVGGSYSGEELAEAGRLTSHLAAYVQLSPGSFSDESIDEMDASGAPWFFIVCRNERYLKEITQEVRERSTTVELLILPGTHHVTRILENYPEMNERIALWFSLRL